MLPWLEPSEVDILWITLDCAILQTLNHHALVHHHPNKGIMLYPFYCAGLDFPSASITFKDLRLVKWNGVRKEVATLFAVLASTSSILLSRFLVWRRLSLEGVSRKVSEVGRVEVGRSVPDGTGVDSTLGERPLSEAAMDFSLLPP